MKVSLPNLLNMLSILRQRKLVITRRVVLPNQVVKREAAVANPPPRVLIPNTSLLLRRDTLPMSKPRKELLTILVLTRVAP